MNHYRSVIKNGQWVTDDDGTVLRPISEMEIVRHAINEAAQEYCDEEAWAKFCELVEPVFGTIYMRTGDYRRPERTPP